MRLVLPAAAISGWPKVGRLPSMARCRMSSSRRPGRACSSLRTSSVRSVIAPKCRAQSRAIWLAVNRSEQDFVWRAAKYRATMFDPAEPW